MLCSGECTMHAIVTSIGGKADPPLIRGIGLIFERTVRPAGTLPLRDLATHRRADAGPARNSPHNQKGCPKFPAICKSYLLNRTCGGRAGPCEPAHARAA